MTPGGIKGVSKGENMKNKVRVGQIWRDWDIRYRTPSIRARLIKIISISGDGLYATCENVETLTMSKIRIDRFKPTSTGYKLFM